MSHPDPTKTYEDDLPINNNKMETKAVQKEVKLNDSTIDNLLTIAIEKKVPVNTMEKLLAMRKELKAEQAKKAFDEDMASLQSEMPVINKDTAGGQTRGGQVAYHYATLDSIISQTKKYIKKYNFSYAIKTEVKDGYVTSIAIVKHTEGHQEDSSMKVPIGGGTNIMSEPQKVAAASTFAKRYAFCNAFGIITGDEDNDAQDYVQAEVIEERFTPKPVSNLATSKQVAKIFAMVKPLGCSDKEKARAFCASLLSKQDFQFSKLTKKEASEIISKIEKQAPTDTNVSKDDIAEIDKEFDRRKKEQLQAAKK